MNDEPTLSLLTLRMVKQNAEDFVKQNAGDTTKLMPMLPKRVIAICNTAITLLEAQCTA